MVTGRVHTALEPPPYPLPAQKTRSGWRSCSSPGSSGYNELMMDDAAGAELVNLQAERDLTALVKRDEDAVVGHDRDRAVGHDERVNIGQHQQTTVGVNRVAMVGAHDELTVGVKHAVAVMPEPGGDSAGDPTTLVMTHRRIRLDTGGGAFVLLEGAEITLKADAITIIGQDEVVAQAAKGDLRLLGGPLVKVNC
jgi:type VI secretion system secreted protein VgrG